MYEQISEDHLVVGQEFLPGLASEQAALEASGAYTSHTFEGWSVSENEWREAASVVQEAYALTTSRQAEEYLHDARDVWLHSVEVAGLTVLALRRMGFDREVQNIGAQTAFWHDVGKENDAVRAITSVDRALTPDERKEMEKHAIISAELAQASGASPQVVVGALYHHAFIRPDGKKAPYPHHTDVTKQLALLTAEQLDGNDDLRTVIATVAVADHFSAVATGGAARSYHEPIASPSTRLDIIAQEIEVPSDRITIAMHAMTGVPLAA